MKTIVAAGLAAVTATVAILALPTDTVGRLEPDTGNDVTLTL